MELNCGNCKHFVKHYIFLDERFIEIKSGHCIYPMNKSRKSMDKVCQHFEEREETKIEFIEITIKRRTL